MLLCAQAANIFEKNVLKAMQKEKTMAGKLDQHIGDDQLVHGMPKHMSVVAGSRKITGGRRLTGDIIRNHRHVTNAKP